MNCDQHVESLVRERGKDKPKDTTDCVAMETKAWKRTQGPQKLNLP